MSQEQAFLTSDIKELGKGGNMKKGVMRLSVFRLWKVGCYSVTALSLLFVVLGCAAGLTHTQKRELVSYSAKGFAVEEKNPGLAAGLGLLPGGGSFYTRQYGLGVVDLLFWPLSILWDPLNAYNSAETINYYATKEAARIHMEKEFRGLDEGMEDGKLNEKSYILEKRKIEKKYAPD